MEMPYMIKHLNIFSFCEMLHNKMGNLEGGSMSIHASIISFLLCFGVALNILFLMSVKGDKKKLNNNEKIQVYKTCLLILAMMCYIPFELWTIQTVDLDPMICRIKDTLQTLLLDPYPILTTAIAIMRLRLALWPDRMELLKDKIYFVVIISGCSVLPISVATSKMVIHSLLPNNTNSTNLTEQDLTYCYQKNPIEIQYFNIGSSILMYGLPSLLVIVMYSGIVHISSVSFNRVQQFGFNTSRCRRVNIFGRNNQISNANVSCQESSHMTQHQTRGTKIAKSVITLVLFFLLATIPICSIEIYLNATYLDGYFNIMLVYLKAAMSVFHVFGEGIFFMEKRRKAKLFFEKLVTRSGQSTTVIRRLVSRNSNTVVPSDNISTNCQTPMVNVRYPLSPIEELTVSGLSSRNGISQNISDEGNYSERRFSCRILRQSSIISESSSMSNRRFSGERIVVSSNMPRKTVHSCTCDIENGNVNSNNDVTAQCLDRDVTKSFSYLNSKYGSSESKTYSMSSFQSYSIHSNLSEATTSLQEDCQCRTPLSAFSTFSRTDSVPLSAFSRTDSVPLSAISTRETVFDFTPSPDTYSSHRCWVSTTSILTSPISPGFRVVGTTDDFVPSPRLQMNGIRDSVKRLSVISDTL